MGQTAGIDATSLDGGSASGANRAADLRLAALDQPSAQDTKDATKQLADAGITKDSMPNKVNVDGDDYSFKDAVDHTASLNAAGDKEGASAFVSDLASAVKAQQSQQADSSEQPQSQPSQPDQGSSQAQPQQGEQAQNQPQQGSPSSSGSGSSSGLPADLQSLLDGLSDDDLLDELDGKQDPSKLNDLINSMLAKGMSPSDIKSALKDKADKALQAKGASPDDIANENKKIDNAVDAQVGKASNAENGGVTSSTSMPASTMKTYG